MNVSAAMLIRLIENFFILLVLKGCGKLNTKYEKPDFEKSLSDSKKTSIFRFNERDFQVHNWLSQKFKW
jgi:hypothetical protein